MTAPSLTEFLFARFADQEKRAREDAADAMVGWRWKHYPEEAYRAIQSLTLETSKWRLADVESKRRIVEEHAIAEVHLSKYAYVVVDGKRQPAYMGGGCCRCHEGEGGNPVTGEPGWCDTLAFLAAPFADHPDYQEAWKL